MNWLKLAVLAGGVIAAGTAVVLSVIDEVRRQKELDDFLLPEEDEPVVVNIPAEETGKSSLEEDLKEFVSFDADKFPVVLTFGFKEDANVAEKTNGLSLDNKVDDVSSSIDVTISSIDEKSLPEIQASLEQWIKDSDAVYQGYHFAG
jgi:vacuolar-type H+-ATPase subunit F/Vma7